MSPWEVPAVAAVGALVGWAAQRTIRWWQERVRTVAESPVIPSALLPMILHGGPDDQRLVYVVDCGVEDGCPVIVRAAGRYVAVDAWETIETEHQRAYWVPARQET